MDALLTGTPAAVRTEEILTLLFELAVETNDMAGAHTWCTERRRLYPNGMATGDCALTLLALSPEPDAASAWRVAARVDRAGNRRVPSHLDLATALVLAGAGLADSAEVLVRRAYAAADPTDADLLLREARVRVLLRQYARAGELLDEYVGGRATHRRWVYDSRWFRPLRSGGDRPRAAEY